MQFLYPGVLWALGLVAVPIIIHLFNFRRVKKIYFSNTSFLQQVKRETKKRSQLKKLLILSARILFIIFLVLAFAQPVTIQPENTLISLRKIYLDNSLSMSRQGLGGMSLLDEGVQIVEGLIATGESGLNYSLTTNDFKTDPSRVMVGKELSERMTEVDFSRRFRTFDDVMNRWSADLASATDEFFIISDFQESVAGDLTSLVVDTTTTINLVKLSNETSGNIYVDSVYLDAVLGLNTENNLSVVIRNIGGEDRNDVLVKVFADSIQFSTFTLDIPAQAKKTTEVNIGTFEEISGNYFVEIEDYAQTFDNKYYFTINEPEKIKVTIIYEGKVNRFLSAAFANESIFVLNTYSLSNINYQQIQESDLIVIDGLPRIPDWVGASANTGNTILVVPGETPDISSYQQLLQISIEQTTDSISYNLSAGSLQSPLFEGIFSNLSSQISLPSLSRPYNLKGFYNTLLNSNAGKPFLIKSGQSNVLFFTTPLTDSYTDFHKHALFIPVLYKVAQSATNESQNLAYSFDQQFISITDNLISEAALPTISNGFQSFVPGVIRTGAGTLLDIPEEITEPGFYVLIVDQDTIKQLAFNYNKSESFINTLSAKEFGSVVAGSPNVRIYDVVTSEDFSRSFSEISEGTGLWKYALLLALLFLLIEMLLLRFN